MVTTNPTDTAALPGGDPSRRPEIPALQERVRAWLRDEALPGWRLRGVDPETGAFVEARNLDGSPDLLASRRFRVQARQIFSFCYATELGLVEGVEDLVSRAAERMIADYWHDDAGWIFAAAPDGSAVDQRREVYEQAFALLAFAWLHRVFRADRALDWIDRTLGFIERRCGDPRHGGFLEGVPPSLPRRQNPHMHLLEAMLELQEATGDEAYLGRAGAILELFRARFFDPARGTLGEFFAQDWTPASTPQRVEPGHHFEWVWLLDRYGRATGAAVPEMDALYDFALDHGVSPDDGFAFDQLLSDGSRVSGSKRIWPQLEMLKALVVQARRRRAGALDRIGPLVEALLQVYMVPGTGCWHDRLGPDGRAEQAACPASGFYHVIVAFDEFLKLRSGDPTP